MTHLEIQDRLIALTQELILIPGTARRPDDLQRCYAFVRELLVKIPGINVDEYVSQGLPSLIARPSAQKSTSEHGVLLCAHLDVVDHDDLSAYRSRVENGRIVGPGAGDMKGALAILIDLFIQLHTRTPGLPLSMAVTSDEETGGEHGMGYLFGELGIKADVAINPDGGSLHELVTEEKGALHLNCTCKGVSTHAARPWLGDNPLEHLVARLLALKATFEVFRHGPNTWIPTCTVTAIHTPNHSANVIPDEVTAVLDVRFPAPHQMRTILHQINKVLGDRITVTSQLEANPLKLEPDPAFMRAMEAVTGRAPELLKEDGASDSRFLIETGTPTIMSRPIVGGLHREDEWIDVESMVQFHQICEQYIRGRT